MWAQCLSRALAAAAHHNDTRHWLELQMLTKCVLCAPPRAGKEHANQRLAFTRHRLQRWLDGDRAALWQDVPAYRAVTKRAASNEKLDKSIRHRQCDEHCRDGADSKACKALYSPGLLNPADVLDEMTSKHPLAPQPPNLLRLGIANTGLVPSAGVDDIVAAIQSFNKHSGAGPSGMRPFHLKEALVPGYSDQVLGHLSSVVNLLTRGRAPRDIAPWLCGAQLMALPKKDGSCRPIAVGEVFRRLAAKTLCTAYRAQATSYLWPLQIGVAQPLGTEVGLQVARQWCLRNSNSPNKVFVKLDFANAFNTIDREFFLKEVRDHMPGLAAWADFCYSSPSKLVFGSRTIGSECGVQQGDPLGPLFFSLALQPVLQELARSRVTGGLELVYSYLDDLCLAGDAQAVATAITTLTQRCSDIGLRLSTGTPEDKGKCETVLVGQAASTVDVRLFPQDFNIVRDGNFNLLGGPIGTADFCNRHTQSRVTKAVRVLEALGELPDPQVALQLLRRCGAFSKMVFSARVVPASFHAEALASFDAQVRACFEQFSCLHPDEDQWVQATLNNDSGGLGLRSLVKHSHAAYLASRSSCCKLCKELDPGHVFELPHGGSPSPERVSLSAYNASVNSDACLGEAGAEPWSQKALSKAIDERTLAELSASACQSRRAHLKLIGASGAGLWLNATPSKAAQLNNDPALFVAMLRRWLRMPFTDQDVECPCCGGVLDSFGDHALVCS